MKNLIAKIETEMTRTEPAPVSAFRLFLRLSSVVYGAAVQTRSHLYRQGLFPLKRLPCHVISIGNLTVGGTGKTPMAIYTARTVHSLGFRTAVVSRGYKGRLENAGGIVSDGGKTLLDANMAGDEPFVMANSLPGIPVVVGKNRFASGRLAIERFGTEVIVLDDAFQHFALKRDLDVVLLDHQNPFGNEYLLPRGTLREPLSALNRAHAVVFTRTNPKRKPLFSEALHPEISGKPVFHTIHEPFVARVIPAEKNPQEMNLLENKKVFAFSGIAKNRDFRSTLRHTGCTIADYLEFPDHHGYTDKDLDRIHRFAAREGAEMVLTTEKDCARLPRRLPWTMPTVVIGIRIGFLDPPDAFQQYLQKKLAACPERTAEG